LQSAQTSIRCKILFLPKTRSSCTGSAQSTTDDLQLEPINILEKTNEMRFNPCMPVFFRFFSIKKKEISKIPVSSWKLAPASILPRLDLLEDLIDPLEPPELGIWMLGRLGLCATASVAPVECWRARQNNFQFLI
jgi:hypothetical protein